MHARMAAALTALRAVFNDPEVPYTDKSHVYNLFAAVRGPDSGSEAATAKASSKAVRGLLFGSFSNGASFNTRTGIPLVSGALDVPGHYKNHIESAARAAKELGFVTPPAPPPEPTLVISKIHS